VSFVMVTSGFACIEPIGSQTMAAMRMSSAHAAGHVPLQSLAPVQKEAPAAPCKFPWAPDGCQSMVPCAPAALASVTSVLDPSGLVPERVMPASAITLLSVTSPPELPPPRA